MFSVGEYISNIGGEGYSWFWLNIYLNGGGGDGWLLILLLIKCVGIECDGDGSVDNWIGGGWGDVTQFSLGDLFGDTIGAIVDIFDSSFGDNVWFDILFNISFCASCNNNNWDN